MANGSETIKNHAAFIWSVADLLRGDYKHSEYGNVVLPLTVLNRFDERRPRRLGRTHPPPHGAAMGR